MECFLDVLRHVIRLATLSRLARQRGEHGGGAAAAALREHLNTQPLPVLHALALVMYAGRGDLDFACFRDHLPALGDSFPTSRRAVGQLVEKVQLADYLTSGLRMLEESGIDPDELVKDAVSA